MSKTLEERLYPAGAKPYSTRAVLDMMGVRASIFVPSAEGHIYYLTDDEVKTIRREYGTDDRDSFIRRIFRLH